MRSLYLLLPLAGSCSSTVPTRDLASGSASVRQASAPLEANWKERLEQPYVFLDVEGDYRRIAGALRELQAAAQQQGLVRNGELFALFFDDPGRVEIDELRSRVCFPVAERPDHLGSTLQFEVLPRAMVVYARVQGAHSAVGPAYPALFSYLRELGWQQGGPVREIYLSSPRAADRAELLTEIQIPWAARTELRGD